MLAESYRTVRSFTTALATPLSEEDSVVQSMPDASPTKWHLAHTTWFFETFVLLRFEPTWRDFHPQYQFLFNSYYESVGDRHPRPERGLITRPSLHEIGRYREHVDAAMLELLSRHGDEPPARDVGEEQTLRFAVTLGLHHEQQHQELLLTDILHGFSKNPLRPAYRGRAPEQKSGAALPMSFCPFREGVYQVGDAGRGEFAFDNERPFHRVFIESYELGNRLVTNGEYLEFMLDGGYERPELWLSDGWAAKQAAGWQAPLYWEKAAPNQPFAHSFTLDGMIPIDPLAPVCHVSFYEADAYARWAKARLPTEFEWEIAAQGAPKGGNFVETGLLRPRCTTHPQGQVSQMFGDVWEWTQSPYVPYPGFVPFAGAFGEYNGKFMCNQIVLRGGSCVTSETHVRATYRNFFAPHARWQYSGIRLAR